MTWPRSYSSSVSPCPASYFLDSLSPNSVSCQADVEGECLWSSSLQMHLAPDMGGHLLNFGEVASLESLEVQRLIYILWLGPSLLFIITLLGRQSTVTKTAKIVMGSIGRMWPFSLSSWNSWQLHCWSCSILGSERALSFPCSSVNRGTHSLHCSQKRHCSGLYAQIPSFQTPKCLNGLSRG